MGFIVFFLVHSSGCLSLTPGLAVSHQVWSKHFRVPCSLTLWLWLKCVHRLMLVDLLKAFLCHHLPVELSSGRSTETWGFFVFSTNTPLARQRGRNNAPPCLRYSQRRVKVANEGSGVANSCTSCVSSPLARLGVSQQCPGLLAVDVQLRRAVGVVTTHLAAFTAGAEGMLSVTHFQKKFSCLWDGLIRRRDWLCSAGAYWRLIAGVPSSLPGSVCAPGLRAGVLLCSQG